MVIGTLAIRLTITEAGAAYLAPTCASAVLAWVWLSRASRGAAAVPLSRCERRSMWSYGWRSLASFSGLTLNRSADQLTRGLLGPARSLGVYSVAVAASSPLPALAAALGMVGLPTVAALSGRRKIVATWKSLRRAIFLLTIISPPLAIILPWAIPAFYGPQYSAAVMPAEILLLGAVFTGLASVADDLLRAHGHPGFVTVSQGAGGVVTAVGTVLLVGHHLSAVAIASSLGKRDCGGSRAKIRRRPTASLRSHPIILPTLPRFYLRPCPLFAAGGDWLMG
jgi:O-antigen/teichoic acid export membrane protein